MVPDVEAGEVLVNARRAKFSRVLRLKKGRHRCVLPSRVNHKTQVGRRILQLRRTVEPDARELRQERIEP